MTTYSIAYPIKSGLHALLYTFWYDNELLSVNSFWYFQEST